MKRRTFVGGLLANIAMPDIAGAVFRPVNTAEATLIFSQPYSCMPYMAQRPMLDGTLVCAVTYNVTAGAQEGDPDQHVGVLRSTDNGNTWVFASVLELVSEPVSSWAMLWLDDNDDLYAFYQFNYQNYTTSTREDCIGCIAWKKSTDGGLTWGARNLLQIPTTAIDLRNPYAGARKLFWLTGHPQKGPDGKLYIGLSKMGNLSFTDTEAYVMRFAVPPTQASVELLPPIRSHLNPTLGIQEEPSVLIHADGVINVTFRTTSGRLHDAWLSPGDAAFSTDYARRIDNNLGIYNSRSMNTMFRLPDGRLLLACYNNERSGQPGAWTRTPLFYRLGERVGPRIRWGQEYLLAYNSGYSHESYVSFCASGSELLLATTDKQSNWLCRYPLADL